MRAQLNSSATLKKNKVENFAQPDSLEQSDSFDFRQLAFTVIVGQTHKIYFLFLNHNRQSFTLYLKQMYYLCD